MALELNNPRKFLFHETKETKNKAKKPIILIVIFLRIFNVTNTSVVVIDRS